MFYLLLGIVALVVALYGAHWFTHVNPAILAHHVRNAAGALLLALAALVLVRGAVAPAGALAMAGAWLLGWMGSGGGRGGLGSGQSANTSSIATDTLAVELDLDTGALTGRVLKGIFQGREIESLRPVEVALLWRDCQFTDPQSAQILEAYLDRTHPTWREDMARGESAMQGGADGRMTVKEAYEILGLSPGVSEDEIRRVHRELMKKFHPDRGGSTYLASKINEAKDVLLGQ